MFGQVVSQSRVESVVKTFHPTITFWVVFSRGDMIHTESSTNFHRKLWLELRAIVGKYVRRNTEICHPVLSNNASYGRGARFSNWYWHGQYSKTVRHDDH